MVSKYKKYIKCWKLYMSRGFGVWTILFFWSHCLSYTLLHKFFTSCYVLCKSCYTCFDSQFQVSSRNPCPNGTSFHRSLDLVSIKLVVTLKLLSLLISWTTLPFPNGFFFAIFYRIFVLWLLCVFAQPSLFIVFCSIFIWRQRLRMFSLLRQQVSKSICSR